MEKNRNKKNIIIPVVFLAGISMLAVFVYQAAGSECGLLTGSEKDKCEDLEKKAEIYSQIIEIKQKQKTTLSSQINLMDSNIKQLQGQIDSNKRQLDDLNEQIIRLTNQVDEKKIVIEGQKVLLSRLIQSYYENGQRDMPTILLSDTPLSSVFTDSDHLVQTGSKITDLLDSVTEIKKGMEDQIAAISEKKNKIIDLHNTLQGQSSELEDTMQGKQTLLEQTKGEEARYTQLLARVEEQKQELLDIDEFFAASGLSADSYPKPAAALFASESWYYSQKDPRWGNMTIGNSKTLMKSYGCAVTSVAMVLTNHGSSMTPRTLAKQPIFSWDLIAWPQSFAGSRITLAASGFAHGNLNWSAIDNEIKKGNPVIVFIKKTTGKGGHYVVIHHKDASTGKYAVHDPYFGPNIFLDTSRALVGAMGTNSSTIIDQMIIYK